MPYDVDGSYAFAKEGAPPTITVNNDPDKVILAAWERGSLSQGGYQRDSKDVFSGLCASN